MGKVLLVDDAKDIHLLLREVLSPDLVLTSAYDLKQCLNLIQREVFDIILLDVNFPDGNGFEFFAELRTRATTQHTPIIFLTGKSDISAKSIGFSLGADDYIVKPFDPFEVKLRTQAKLRKQQAKAVQESQQMLGNLRFDIPSQKVYIQDSTGEKVLDLTPTGFKLLHYLARHEGHIFTRDQLINSVWGTGTFVVDRTVDTHVSAIRKQLNPELVMIQAVHGQGYKLVSHSEKIAKSS